ncbi:carbon-nitrogen family hydrolase [Flexivirga sp. B27]
MQIAVIQLAYDDSESLADRTSRVCDLVRSESGADLVVLPELWSAGGFSYRDWPSRSQDVGGAVVSALADAARDAGVWLHGGSIAEHPASGETGPEGKSLWNTSLLFAPDGSLAASYRKIHRFGFAGGEPKLMEAGSDIVVLEAAGVTMGLSTCYDLRFPELYRAQVDRGATVFVIPAAWPEARVEAWRLLLRARAIEDQCLVIACNTAGTHAGTPMGGRSAVIAADGEVLAEAGTDQEILRVDADPAAVGEFREAFPVLRDRRL